MIPIGVSLIEILLPLLFIVICILFFIPAIFEMKRPKDARLRREMNIGISDFAAKKAISVLGFLLDLEDIEREEFSESHFETVMVRVRNPIFVLSNIEGRS